MGMFDSFWMKTKCPHCGNSGIFEFQTKKLVNCLISWKQGQSFMKFKRRIRKYAWCPEITEGVIQDCYAGCKSEKCNAWQKKTDGYTSGFGRGFVGDVVIKNGKVHGVKNVRKDRET